MNLTKVRVKGKRKTPSTNRPLALKKHSLKADKRSLGSVIAARVVKVQPTLDTLPAEILESILLYSANLSLPRVSNLVGMKLSGRATLLRLFMWAFHETWDQWFGIPNDPAIVNGPWFKDAKHAPCRGDYVLQSAVLNQPWITIDLILQAQQTWADNYAQGRWYQHCIPWDDEPSQIEHDHEGGFHHFNARGCFEADYKQALKWPAFRLQAQRWCFHDIHPKTRIPARLVTGPWDEDMQHQLFWLCRGGYMADGEDCTPPTWEDKVEFLRNAILNVSDPNVLVINCLLRNWVFTDLPADVVREELVGLERRLEWGGDTAESRDILRRTRSAFYLLFHLPELDEEVFL